MKEERFSGGLFGSYPTCKYDDHLSESKEVEEFLTEEDKMLEDMQKERYKSRKSKYSKKILGELEAFVERRTEDWGKQEEEQLFDILDLISNEIKSQLSINIPEYRG